MKIKTLTYFILLVLLSCTHTDNKIKILKINEIVLNNINDIPILIESTTKKNYFFYVTKNDSICLYLKDLNNGSEKTINLNVLFDTTNILPFSIYSDLFLDKIINEEIYFISNNKQITSINIINNKISQYKVIGEIKPSEIDYHIYSIRFSPFTYLNDSCFITMIGRNINQSTAEGRKLYFSYPLLGSLQIKNDNALLDNLNAPFPFIAKQSNDYYMDQQLSYCTDDNGNIVYLLNRYPYVYRFNIQSSKLDSFKITSSYIDEKEIIPFNTKYFYDVNYSSLVEKYGYEVPQYKGIKYNSYQKLFYRINSIHTPYYQKNGKKTNYRNWSISVIDKEMKLVGEIPFLKDSIFDFRLFYPSKSGFLIGYKKTKEDKRKKRQRLCEFKILF